MSLHSPLVYTVPEETIRVARAAFPKGNLYMEMQAELGMLYLNPQFAPLFSHTGQPAEDPARLALVLVMQTIEGLSDRQAADQVRSRIDWKYALALPLTDAGFDASVLCEFRARLIAGGLEHLLLDTLLMVLHARGLIRARGKQRTDSTHILAAVRTLNRLELVVETMHAVLNRLSTSAPDWLWPRILPTWEERYARRAENYRFPTAQTKRIELASAVGADGFALLAHVDAPTTPDNVKHDPLVAVLRRVWIQQYYGPDPHPRWRTPADAPPADRLIHSPYDPEARYSVKQQTAWVGYKVHLTETCDADTPHLITHVLTTPATDPDETAVPRIHDDLAHQDRLPAEHFMDAGYTNTTNLLHSHQIHQVHLIGPLVTDTSWQARCGARGAKANFAIDWAQQRVTCPHGATSIRWHPRANGTIQVGFAIQACRPCPIRTQCTKSKHHPREVLLLPQPAETVLRATRHAQQTPEFRNAYRRRAGVESLIAQGIRVCGLRRTRFIGTAKTHLQHILIAVAINIVRFIAWVREDTGTHPPQRKPAFARLVTLT